MVWLNSEKTWTVQCGKDQTFNDVLVDTGSAILWVGAEKPYIQGSNTEVYVFRSLYVLHLNFFFIQRLYSINSTFSVGYGAGGVQGIAYRDTVVIGDATGRSQLIGGANKTSGFHLVKPIDGIRTSLFSFFLLINIQIYKYELCILPSRFGTIY